MELIIIVAVAIIILGIGAFAFWRRRPLNTERFQDKWRELQQLCRNKEDWPKAIAEADVLLDEALRKKRISGKTMGERMVKAQRIFTDNDSVWFGHKLRSKIDGDPKMRLKEEDVKTALVGIRQALKDLGALPK